MENNENSLFESIQEFFQSFKGGINIINEKIDISLQMEYFDMSKKNKDIPFPDWEEKSQLLWDPLVELDEKKKILTRLASVEDVRAYRLLEKFANENFEDLKQWSILALQESKMLIQSKLLDQAQVLISTGLGGKGDKLRFFFVLFNKNNESYTDLQQKIIKNEFEYIFNKNSSEIEEINFYDNIATIVALVPISISIQNLFVNTISEINQYGNFVKDNCIITNVKILSIEEIKDFMSKNSSNSEEI